MLLFHICIPFAVEHFRPRATIKTVLFHWFSTLGWALGLSEFLLPGTEEANGVNANNHEERGGRGQERGNGVLVEGNNARGPVDVVANHNQSPASLNNDMDYDDEEETETDE